MTESPSPSALSRRRVMGGLAWSVPTVAVTVAAPSFAASPGREVTVTVEADRWNGVDRTISIPGNAYNLTFEVIGGGGGTYYVTNKNNAPWYAERGGHGARITGQIATTGAPMTLWVVAGGGGWGTGDSGRQSVNSTGFGNGGSSQFFYDALPIAAWSNGWAMGGGAGSAIALGSAPSAGGTLLVAAGGGGSAGLYDHTRRQTYDYSSDASSGGLGGDAPGGDGTPYTVTFRTGSLTAPAGSGASGGTGGAGGAAGSHEVSNAKRVDVGSGNKGGDAGTGNFGGGNGAEPIELRRYAGQLLRMATAAGGGGYAGGGSGGGILVDSDDSVVNNLGSGRNAILGVMGAGGGGSNFISGSAPVSGAQVSSALNGGTYQTRVGGPGRVTIRYSVPL